MSPFAQNKVMDLLLASSFLSLHSKEPDGLGSGEIKSEHYTRVKVSDLFLPSKDGTKTLGREVVFSRLPTTSITHVGVWDQEKNGNFIIGIPLELKRELLEGDAFTIPANELSISIS